MISIGAPQCRHTNVGALSWLGRCARRRRRRWGMQQRSCELDVLFAGRVGEQPVVAQTMEAGGQDVQQEAAHELLGGEGHGLVSRAAFGPIVFPAEGDAAFIQAQESWSWRWRRGGCSATDRPARPAGPANGRLA